MTAAKASQVETPSGGHRPTEKGVRKVAADLGLDKSDVQRAVKVASITDEAKQAARDAGLDDNRTALLVVAKAEPEAQVAKVKEIADEKAEREKQPAARSTTKITQARLEGLAGSIGGVLLALECAKPETIDLLVQDIAAGRYGVRSELEALRDWIDRLRPLGVGWHSVVGSYNAPEVDFRLKPNAQRWEGGSFNMPGLQALAASVELLLELGTEQVSQRILDRATAVREVAAEAGWRVSGSKRPEDHSGIVVIEHDRIGAHDAARALREQSVAVAARRGRLRISAHIYNNEEDLQRLKNALILCGRQVSS